MGKHCHNFIERDTLIKLSAKRRIGDRRELQGAWDLQQTLQQVVCWVWRKASCGQSTDHDLGNLLKEVLSVWGQEIYIFCIFIFYAWFGMLLKGMGESFILFEDEPLTPNIDGVMALWIFRRRAQTAENRRKSVKIGPLDSSFYFFSLWPPGRNPFKPSYPLELRKCPR